MPIAFSYVRFSSPSQADGDSLRRQTEKAADWCKRNGVQLDKSLTFHDLGRSAYLGEHRRNPDRHALAAFLKLVEERRIPSGSALILESLDRLSREHIRPALTLLLNLIEAGVKVVQLIPLEAVYDENVEPMQLMMAIMELSRGHSESKVKGQRVGAAWADKRNRVRSEGHILTARLPAWIVIRNGKLELDARKAATVKRIFALAAAGRGHSLILKKLIEDKTPPIASGNWSRSYIAKIVRDRRAIGELQPRTRDGRPDGDPVTDYYPCAITEREYNAARAGSAERRKKPGRTGHNVNLFSNLLFTGGGDVPFYLSNRTGHKNGRPVKVTLLTTAEQAQGEAVSVRYPEFENAVLSELREVDPREVVGRRESSDATALLGQLADLDDRIAKLERELDKGDVATLARAARRLEDHRKTVAAKLAESQEREANPADAALAEVKSLAVIVQKASDPNEVRLRLRTLLRRVVERMHIVIVKRAALKFVALQVTFLATKNRRVYVMALHRDRLTQTISQSWPTSLDLRRPTDCARVEKLLLLVAENLVA